MSTMRSITAPHRLRLIARTRIEHPTELVDPDLACFPGPQRARGRIEIVERIVLVRRPRLERAAFVQSRKRKLLFRELDDADQFDRSIALDRENVILMQAHHLP